MKVFMYHQFMQNLILGTDIDGYNIGEKYHIEIKLENENGEEYQFDSMTAKFDDKKQSCEVEVNQNIKIFFLIAKIANYSSD